MRIIAIVNEKGGTGKTTTAVNLSAALGELGQRVLLVDLDGQAASSRWLGVEEDNRLADALIRGGGLEPIEGIAPGVSLAPASGKLDSVSHELRATQGGQLRKVLSPLQERYDYALIDCPPSLGNRLIGNALLAATHAIVPVEPSILALDGLRILLTTLEDIRDGFDHPIELIGVLACRYEARTRLSKLILAELHRALPGKVFRTVIRETVRMQECPASGSSILEFADKNNAATDYRELARELLAGGPLPGNAAVAAQIEGADDDLDLAEQDRMTIESFRRLARASVGRGVSGEQAGEQTQAKAPAAPQVEAPSQAETPANAETPSNAETPARADASAGTVKADAIDADDMPSQQAPMKIETKAEAIAPPCARAVAAARPEPAKVPDVASATAACTPPTPEVYRPRLDVSQWQADHDGAESHDGPRISPARRTRETRKGLLVGTAAACLALGIWAMVRLSQNTPQTAAGSDHGSGLVVRKANPAPPTSQPSAQAIRTDAADNVTALDKQIESNMGGPSGPSVDTQGLTETTLPLTAEQAAPRAKPSMSQAPTTKPAPYAAAAMPAALVEQAAAQSPTTRPADAANESVQSSDGGAKVAAKADAPAASPTATTSPATRPADPAFHTAPGGYSLGAIMRGPNGSLAIINGKPIGEGATIRGAKVIKIQPLSVELELDGQRFTLGLGRQASDQAPAATPTKSARK
jgi:chromosome partitioning protein